MSSHSSHKQSSSQKNIQWKVLIPWLIGYYVTAIGINIFNSLIYSTRHYAFPTPLFVISSTFICQFMISSILLLIQTHQFIRKMEKETGINERISAWRLLWSGYVKKHLKWKRVIIPCSLATALDIGLAMYGLKTVPLSMYVVVKSAAPASILAFSWVFEKLDPKLHNMEVHLKETRLMKMGKLGSVMGILGGVTLATLKKNGLVDQSDTSGILGLVLVSASTVITGVRWALTQTLILHKNPPPALEAGQGDREFDWLSSQLSGYFKNNPLVPLFALGLPAGLALAMGSFGIEFEPIMTQLIPNWSWQYIVLILAIANLLSFVLLYVEYQFIQRAQSVMCLSLAGIVKELAIIIVSVVWLGEELSLLNWLGLAISLISIYLYSIYSQEKTDEKSEGQASEVSNDDMIVLIGPMDEPMFSPGVIELIIQQHHQAMLDIESQNEVLIRRSQSVMPIIPELELRSPSKGSPVSKKSPFGRSIDDFVINGQGEMQFVIPKLNNNLSINAKQNETTV